MNNNWLLQKGELPAALLEQENAEVLKGVLRGVEREGLRVTPEGRLAQTPHPTSLGSALTHPHITTDYSESLLEFITSPTHSVRGLMDQLETIHLFTEKSLGDEILWNNSMPCTIHGSGEVPVALYGTSNRARMKTIYRIGLGHRYGRIMQTVSGLHFNYSLPTAFWTLLQQQELITEDLRAFTTRRYFNQIRNFRRFYWLLIYLFGASPAVCSSFVAGRPHRLERFGGRADTLYLPYATSLRMGDLGYQSQAQESLYVCYNTRNSYVSTLINAIETPYATYEGLGLYDRDGQRQQLNTGMLQIENEFYSAIRPKRTAHAGETALTALCYRGVEYVEVRCLDINPFSALGITTEQIRFLDVFMLYCALKTSDLCAPQEVEIILGNQKRVVMEGRRPGLQLTGLDGGEIPMNDWAMQLLDGMAPLAELLDQVYKFQKGSYQKALQAQRNKFTDPAVTPSAQVLAAIESSGLSFSGWALENSIAHRDALTRKSLSPELEARFMGMVEESLAMQAEEERQPQISFEDYLAAYYRQYQIDCRCSKAI